MYELITPEKVCIFVTHKCNLACPFCCYRGHQQHGRKDLAAEEWLTFIDSLARLNVMRVSLWGGEPLIRPDLPELIRRIVAGRMRFSLVSNGTLLTEEFASFLADTGRCDWCQISIDGWEADHDAVRGPGNWRKAVDAVKLLRRYRIPVRINMVATESNCRSIVDAAVRLYEETRPARIRINLVADFDHGPVPEELGRPGVSRIVRLIREMLPLRQRYPGVFESSSPLVFYDVIRKDTVSDLPSARCKSLWTSLAVRADGAIITCPSGEESVLGRINRVDLEDIWHNHPLLLQQRRAVIAGKSSLPEQCGECRYAWHCRQLCPVTRIKKRDCYREIAAELSAAGI